MLDPFLRQLRCTVFTVLLSLALSRPATLLLLLGRLGRRLVLTAGRSIFRCAFRLLSKNQAAELGVLRFFRRQGVAQLREQVVERRDERMKLSDQPTRRFQV